MCVDSTDSRRHQLTVEKVVRVLVLVSRSARSFWRVMNVAYSEASTICKPTAPDHQCRPCIDEDQARCLREQRTRAVCVCVSAHWTHHMLTGSILLRRQWLEARGPLQPCGWTSADQREHRCRWLHYIQAVPRSARRLHELRNFRGALPPSRAPTPYINNCPPNPHHTTSLTKLPTPDRLPLAHRWPELRSQFCMVALFVLSSSLVTKRKRRLLALQSYRLAQYV